MNDRTFGAVIVAMLLLVGFAVWHSPSVSAYDCSLACKSGVVQRIGDCTCFAVPDGGLP